GSVICNIIRNPIYAGDIVVNKKRYDFETKRCYRNPKSEWIVRKNVVEPIISRELFELANAAVDARAPKAAGPKVRKSEYMRYPLTGKLICGLCGSPFSRCTRRKNADETGDIRFAEWKCSTLIRKGRTQNFGENTFQSAEGCDNINLHETELYEVLKQFSAEQYQDIDEGKIIETVSDLLREAMETGSTAVEEAGLEKAINRLKAQKATLLDKLLDDVITDDAYKEKAGRIQSQLSVRETELKKIKEMAESLVDIRQRVEKITQFVTQSVIGKAEVNDLLNCIDRIVVYPDKLQLHLEQYALMGIHEDAVEQGLTGEGAIIQTISSEGLQNGAGVRRAAEKEMIVREMSDTPKITARQIAQRHEWPLSRVNRRIIELREEGRIKYSTPNGKGHWIVIK
ncbi:MAG: recombinase family protein, partial [Lachnospiraceae bacterium]|nr:recombinase family protein [Lachnospiraceae bacterium]